MTKIPDGTIPTRKERRKKHFGRIASKSAMHTLKMTSGPLKQHDTVVFQEDADGKLRFMRTTTVLEAAQRAGLQKTRTAKLTARIDPDLLEAARESAGVETDSEVINVALANLAIEDGFVEAFMRSKGAVDPDIDLEM
jgi:hypothetical protein